MIDLYYYTSPNTRKIVIALEELGLDYRLVWVDITRGEQHTDEYRAVNPNAKVPAIIDHDGPGGVAQRVFESGSILMYLAAKTGRLLPDDPGERWEAVSWVFWQAASQGPMSGQAAHFVNYAVDLGVDDHYARTRYVEETRRLYAVLEERLAGRQFLAGDELSIADIACFPWTRVAAGHAISLDDFPAVNAWSAGIALRPSARVRPIDNRDENQRAFKYSPEQAAHLFGPAAVAAFVNQAGQQ
jgi:GSH-dependent disulfide-bond oxidoreductase